MLLKSEAQTRERESKPLGGFVKFLFCFFFFVTFFFTVHSSIYAAYITNPPNEVFLQWKLDNNAANATVTGNQADGSLVGGNTSDVASTVNGYPAFHLNGSSEYVQVNHRNIWPNEVANLWTKYNSGISVITDNPNPVMFGQLTKNPAGGWYFYGGYKVVGNHAGVSRWQSTDLKTWTGKTEVLAPGGAWDADVEVATVFQRISDGTWIMLYRGFNGVNYKIGEATSSDGTTFTRKNNGGVNDGLFPQFGNNIDPVGVMLVGSTYYVYVNGDPMHSVQNIYTSTDDFNTFTAYSGNPIFRNAFCANVWNYSGYYYMLIARDLLNIGTTLYDHAIGLYRSTAPTFDPTNTSFLGYVIVNDTAYDNSYLDTPSVPMTDVYRTTYAPEFGSTLNVIYSQGSLRQGLVSTTFSELVSRQPVTTYSGQKAYSFWIQFDALNDGDPVFSVAATPTSGNPVWLGVVKTSGANKVFSLFMGGDYRLTSQALSINTPYHIVVVDEITDKKVYINDSLVGTFTQGNVDVGVSYLYMGKGYASPDKFLHGYVWDFREYPKALSSTEVDKLYTTGSIDITAPVTIDNTDSSWHKTDVTITLSCTDSGTGCANTYYTTDGTILTTSSSSGTSITLSSDGVYTIKYFSVDVVKNQEAVKTATNTVKIDKTAPTISAVTSTPTSTGATIAWTTNEISSSKIDYGLTNSYGSSTTEIDTSTGVTSHSVALSGLVVCSTYYYRVRSKDEAGNEATGDNTFTTLGTCPTSAPSSIQGSTTLTLGCGDQVGVKASWLYGAIAQDSGSVLLYFTPADNPVSKYVLEYGTKSGDYPYGVQDMGVNARGQMTFLVKSLSPNTTYYFRVRGGNGCATGSWSNEISATTRPVFSTNNLDIVSSELNVVNNPTPTLSQNEEIKPTVFNGYDVKVKVIDTNKKPVQGAKVTIHSKVQETTTDKNGIALFNSVEPGQHKILIAYNNFEGEQTVNLTGDVKEFDFNIQVKEQNAFLNKQVMGVIGIMGLVIVGLVVFLLYRFRIKFRMTK